MGGLQFCDPPILSKFVEFFARISHDKSEVGFGVSTQKLSFQYEPFKRLTGILYAKKSQALI